MKHLLLIFYFLSLNLYSNTDSFYSKKIFVFLDNSLLINNQIEITYELVIEIVLLVLILIGMFVYWNLKLKQSEAKFRTLFDIAPVFLNSFDKNGKIILWNKECEKAFGWTFDEIKNKKIL